MKKFTCNADLIDDDLKRNLMLFSLYQNIGYTKFKSSNFELYDFYREHRDFLVCDKMISFSDTDGTLLAMRADVTLSIINAFNNLNNITKKLYYDEDVYRVSKFTGKFKRYRQLGIECFGDVSNKDLQEVIDLSLSSLSLLSKDFLLVVSDMRILMSVVDLFCLNNRDKNELLAFISRKDIEGLKLFLKSRRANINYTSYLIDLLNINLVSNSKVESELKKITSALNLTNEFDAFKGVFSKLKKSEYFKNIQVDFSLFGDTNYYSGLYFNGFISSKGEVVLAGGEYDKLLEKLGKTGKAIGFAIFQDRL